MANYEIAEAAMLASDRYNDMLILTDADSISLLEQFGLMLDAGYPQIGRAEALSMLVHVPGSGRPLDLSRSLDGRLHYTKRQITAQFSCFRPKAQWGKLQQILELLLHGQWIWFRFKKLQLVLAGQPDCIRAAAGQQPDCDYYGGMQPIQLQHDRIPGQRLAVGHL